jgi:hypothetical protein
MAGQNRIRFLFAIEENHRAWIVSLSTAVLSFVRQLIEKPGIIISTGS